MTNYLRQLEEVGVLFNKPATQHEIRELQSAFGKPLPQQIIDLYVHHNGQPHSYDAQEDETTLCFRLMNIEEVIETLEVLSDEGFDEWRTVIDTYIACWTDDGGNYMAFYLSGDFQNSVAYLSHEVGPLPQLSFPSLDDFYSVQLKLVQDAQNDFDKIFLSHFNFPSQLNNEGLFYKSLNQWKSTQDELWRNFYAKNALQLCPNHLLDKLTEVSESYDPISPNYIRSRLEERLSSVEN